MKTVAKIFVILVSYMWVVHSISKFVTIETIGDLFGVIGMVGLSYVLVSTFWLWLFDEPYEHEKNENLLEERLDYLGELK